MADAPECAGDGVTTRSDFGAPWVLSAAIALLAVVQALGGLLARDLYRDIAWIKLTWLGNDAVVLLVAVPLLVWGLVAARGGSRRGELVWYSMLGFMAYNYAYYLVGAKLNAWFPLYVLLVVLPVIALIMALAHADVAALAESYGTRTPVRAVGGYLLLTGVGLGVVWIAQWAAAIFGGVTPAVGEDAFHVVATLDLSIIVPLMIAGGLLLVRRRPWGFVIAPAAALLGAVYTLILTVNSVLAMLAGSESAAAEVPVWSVWTLVGGAAAVWLLGSVTGRDASV